MALIELSGVSKVYKSKKGNSWLRGGVVSDCISGKVLTNINLSIESGQAMGILGRSGAGKSTLARLICGLESSTDGTIKVHGHSIEVKKGSRAHRLSSQARKDCARLAQMIWQDAPGSMNPRMRVEDIIAEPIRIHMLAGMDQAANVTKLMNEVALPSELRGRFPHELSGGEAQRVIIARALSLNPELLVCDEPASALDVLTKVQIVELLMRLRAERGMALLLIAHDITLIKKLTESLIVLHAGEVVEKGPTVKLLANPEHARTREILEAQPVLLKPSREKT